MRRKVLLSFLCLLMGVFMLGIPAAAAANPGGGTAQPYSFTDPVPPEISVTGISTKYVGDTVTVKATASSPCYRNVANSREAAVEKKP